MTQEIFKQFDLVVNISASTTNVRPTGTEFWTFDVRTARKNVQYQLDGEAIDLTNAIVLIKFVFANGSSILIDSHNDGLNIENAINGEVSIMLPNQFQNITGRCYIHHYIQFADGRSLDAGRPFTTYLQESVIDQDLPELEEFYVSRIEDIINDMKERAEELIGSLEGDVREIVEDVVNEALDQMGDLTGKQGEQGYSAFEIAQQQGFTGTIDEWLESLRGQDGTDGIDGAQGPAGQDANYDTVQQLIDEAISAIEFPDGFDEERVREIVLEEIGNIEFPELDEERVQELIDIAITNFVTQDDLDNLREEIDEKLHGIASERITSDSQWITVTDSREGKIVDRLIEGRTLVNLWGNFVGGLTGNVNGNTFTVPNVNAGGFHSVQISREQFKPSTTYTFLIDARNFANGVVFRVSGNNNFLHIPPTNWVRMDGRYVFTITTTAEFTDINTNTNLSFADATAPTSNVSIDISIFEGDLTNLTLNHTLPRQFASPSNLVVTSYNHDQSISQSQTLQYQKDGEWLPVPELRGIQVDGDLLVSDEISNTEYIQRVFEVDLETVGIGTFSQVVEGYTRFTFSNVGMSLSSRQALSNKVPTIQPVTTFWNTGAVAMGISVQTLHVMISTPSGVTNVATLRQYLIENEYKFLVPLAEPRRYPIRSWDLNSHDGVTHVHVSSGEVSPRTSFKIATSIGQRLSEVTRRLINVEDKIRDALPCLCGDGDLGTCDCDFNRFVTHDELLWINVRGRPTDFTNLAIQSELNPDTFIVMNTPVTQHIAHGTQWIRTGGTTAMWAQLMLTQFTMSLSVGDVFRIQFQGFREGAWTAGTRLLMRYIYTDNTSSEALNWGTIPIHTNVTDIDTEITVHHAPDPNRQLSHINLFLQRDNSGTGFINIRELRVQRKFDSTNIQWDNVARPVTNIPENSILNTALPTAYPDGVSLYTVNSNQLGNFPFPSGMIMTERFIGGRTRQTFSRITGETYIRTGADNLWTGGGAGTWRAVPTQTMFEKLCAKLGVDFEELMEESD